MEFYKLEECCEILDSQRIPITESNRSSGEYPYYGANGVQDYISEYIFDDELVLLAEDGGNFGSKTKPIAYRVSGKCWVNNHAHVLKPKPLVDVDYLCYSLMFYNVGGLVNGATRQKLTQAAMKQMLIPKRTRHEQTDIVKRIKKVEQIIKKRKQQLTALDTLVKAPIGKVAIAGKEMYCNQGFKNLICSDRISAYYLFWFLRGNTEYLNSLGRGATFKEISKSIVENIRIQLPSMSEQINCAKTLKKIWDVMAFRKQQLRALDTLVKARFVEMFGNPVTNSKGWPVYQLMEYIEFLTSGSRGWAQYFTDDGEYFITIKNVKNCRITVDDVQHIIPPDNAEAKRTKVQEGDLLISITADLGRTGVVDRQISEHGGYINQHLTCIRLNKRQLNPLYVAYYMESDAGKIQFQAKNQSAVKAGLNFNSINSLRLMVPPLELQNQFAAFVAQVDKSRDTIQNSS